MKKLLTVALCLAVGGLGVNLQGLTFKGRNPFATKGELGALQNDLKNEMKRLKKLYVQKIKNEQEVVKARLTAERDNLQAAFDGVFTTAKTQYRTGQLVDFTGYKAQLEQALLAVKEKRAALEKEFPQAQK